MRYVEKHFDAPSVILHEQELSTANLDEASLLKRKETEGLDGNLLYKEQIRSTKNISHWKDLQVQMCQDQGGVCCYCGMKLQFPDTQHYSVEHVQPRSKFPELVGEYKNLLLSCHSSELERAQLKETIHSKKERKKTLHCDEFKGNKELHYNPLQADCASHFSYKLNGEVKGSDKEAEEDIETLNLNCNSLKERRREQMLAYSFLTRNSQEMLDMDSLKAYRQEVEKRDANGNHREFYFVIADLLDQLLPVV